MMEVHEYHLYGKAIVNGKVKFSGNEYFQSG